MNAIFLDIDGVLNCYGINGKGRSKSRCGNFLGIDKDKTQNLAKIVQKTDAILILISSWKIGWEPKGAYKINGIDSSNYHAKYLDNHLKKKGNLILTDKTFEFDSNYRGKGIKDYLKKHPEITNWIVIDDEIFIDYEIEEILPHLIKINPIYGLTDENINIAIQMLQERN